MVQLDNKSYERNQKLESKRQLEEAICQVVGKPDELVTGMHGGGGMGDED